MADGCTFCRIIAGEVPAHLVLEDDDFVAFLDTRPLFPGHVLLVPREHVVTIMDAPRDMLGPLAERTQESRVPCRRPWRRRASSPRRTTS